MNSVSVKHHEKVETPKVLSQQMTYLRLKRQLHNLFTVNICDVATVMKLFYNKHSNGDSFAKGNRAS